MYSRDEPFLRSLECYFGIYFPRCFATREINTKITLSWALKRFVTRVHASFAMYITIHISYKTTVIMQFIYKYWNGTETVKIYRIKRDKNKQLQNILICRCSTLHWNLSGVRCYGKTKHLLLTQNAFSYCKLCKIHSNRSCADEWNVFLYQCIDAKVSDY